MIETIVPDERGRVSILPYLRSIKWKFGQAVEVDIIKTVDLPDDTKDEESNK